MKDFTKCKIYKLVLKGSDECDDMYIGSTIRSLAERMVVHRLDARRGRDTNVYKWMRDVGVENVQIVLLEEYRDCQNFEQQRQREREWIEKLKPSLNTVLPYRSLEERLSYNREYSRKHYDAGAIKEKNRVYREANTETIKEKARAYHAANAKAIKERKRKYREANTETMKEKARAYHAANRQAIKERKHKYREANAEVINEYQRAYREANRQAIKEKARARYRARKESSSV